MGKQWKLRDFIFLGPKVTADGDCSHEIKRCLLLGRKAMTNLDRILKSTDITLPTKVCLVKAMVFPVVTYRSESWTIKKAEHQRIDAFWTVVLEKTLESPLECKGIKPVNPKGNQPWIFIGRTDAEDPLLWLPDNKRWLTGKDCNGGKIKARRTGNRGWDGWMAPPTQWTWVWANWERVKDREAWYAVVHGVAKSQTWLSDRTTKINTIFFQKFFLCHILVLKW